MVQRGIRIAETRVRFPVSPPFMDIRNEIGIIPTDTIYGLVGQALDKKIVERIYAAKGRRPDKPFIILIYSIKELSLFGVKLSSAETKIIEKYWPGKVSIILPCPAKKFEYLHRGTKSLAFRLPRKKSLLTILKKTGPLVAPSANPEGQAPAKNITEAKKYFGDKVDLYIAGAKLAGKASKIIKLIDSKIEIIRP